MQGGTPWLICTGVFLMPVITFALGLYIGKRGLPIEIEVRRRDRTQQAERDMGYGQG
jgi:hypothetical protein